MFIIYKALHVPTGKIYVGRTVQPLQQRIGQHWGETGGRRKPFHEFLHTTLMSEWDWSIIQTVETKNEAIDCEAYYISEWDLYEKGLNTPPGIGGANQEINRKASSERMSAYQATKPEPWHKGRKGVYSEETLERMRLAKLRNPTRRVFTEEDKKKASLAASNSKQIVELRSLLRFNSISATAKHFDIRREAVRDVVNGKRSHTGGLIFVEEGRERFNEFMAHAQKIVEQQKLKGSL